MRLRFRFAARSGHRLWQCPRADNYGFMTRRRRAPGPMLPPVARIENRTRSDPPRRAPTEFGRYLRPRSSFRPGVDPWERGLEARPGRVARAPERAVGLPIKASALPSPASEMSVWDSPMTASACARGSNGGRPPGAGAGLTIPEERNIARNSRIYTKPMASPPIPGTGTGPPGWDCILAMTVQPPAPEHPRAPPVGALRDSWAARSNSSGRNPRSRPSTSRWIASAAPVDRSPARPADTWSPS